MPTSTKSLFCVSNNLCRIDFVHHTSFFCLSLSHTHHINSCHQIYLQKLSQKLICFWLKLHCPENHCNQLTQRSSFAIAENRTKARHSVLLPTLIKERYIIMPSFIYRKSGISVTFLSLLISNNTVTFPKFVFKISQWWMTFTAHWSSRKSARTFWRVWN